MKITLRSFASALVCALGLAATPGGAGASVEEDPLATYLVELQPGAVPAAMAGAVPGVAVRHTFGAALNGFSAAMPAAVADRLAAHPRVVQVVADGPVSVTATQSDPPWSLDRVDQRTQPLSDSFNTASDGAGVTAYVIDTGIRRTHQDFGGRVRAGFDVFGGNASDCNGHGTHVAGSLGGTRYGVAKQVDLVAVKVFSCGGVGTWEGLLSALDWVVRDHRAGEPAVANLSLSGGAYSLVDKAVRNLIAEGITVAVAAGNSNTEACYATPARVGEALTVAASTRLDARAGFSNYGGCVDLFAPGTAVESAYFLSDTDRTWKDGTSMAAPHVAGAAAVLLGADPALAPGEVHRRIVDAATRDLVLDARAGTPNRLLYLAPPDPGPLGVEAPQGLPEPPVAQPFVDPWNGL